MMWLLRRLCYGGLISSTVAWDTQSYEALNAWLGSPSARYSSWRRAKLVTRFLENAQFCAEDLKPGGGLPMCAPRDARKKFSSVEEFAESVEQRCSEYGLEVALFLGGASWEFIFNKMTAQAVEPAA